ncbi:MAG: SUMF1/EgtB/PvdO family nonheme iron enzyme [Candidatus Krumholzibacteria bacterium]|nr:SUMF1/EgtB/PvdO family nonheme iron enzyme [Candidatus Krumholzibacteria bacterium]
MKRSLMLFSIVIFISISFFNCGDDDVTGPEDNGSPVATITGPVNGASFTGGAIIDFTGTGIDSEDGTLPEDSLLWTSDKDGEMGTGTSVSTSLSVNDHTITLTVTDSDGNTGSGSITIHVESGNELISVSATAGYPMGWDDFTGGHADPAHTVSLNAFRIGKFEVTYEIWMDVKVWADANGYIMNDGVQGDGMDRTDQHPVTDVHWRDCVAWCNARSEKEGLTPVYYTDGTKTTLYKNASHDGDGNIGSECVSWASDGYRLPTEAEWEYAARYIDGTSFSPGDKHSGYNLDPDIDNCAWFRDNSHLSTEPVGQLQANSLGAYDMSGNVYEWCWDWYDGDYYSDSPTSNPRGPATGVYRIIRGGCWGESSADIYAYIAHRSAVNPYTIHRGGGFRICRSGSGQ